MRSNSPPITPDTASFWRVAALILSICAVTWVCVQPQVSNDFWMQAKVGEWTVLHHAVPNVLLFPFTEVQDQTFHAHEWLASVLFYLCIQVFGEGGLPLVLGALGVGLFALTVSLSMRRTGSGLAFGLLCGLLAMVVENYRHFLRPELLSLFLFLLFWSCLDAYAIGRSKAVVLGAVVIAILWANIHGSFILAPMMALIYALGTVMDAHRPKAAFNMACEAHWYEFAAIALITFLCCLINPSGWELIQFVVGFSSSSVSKQLVLEWMPTFDSRLRHVPGVWIGVTCGFILSALVLIYRRRLRSSDMLLLLLLLALSVKANRFLVYLGLAGAMLLPAMYGVRPHHAQRKIYVVTSCIGLLILLLAMRFGNANGNFPYKADFQEIFSAPMIKTLSNDQMKGAVFTSYDLGAELTYRGYPRLRASIDSRIDSYGDDYFFYHELLLDNSEMMDKFITRYDIRYMLLTHSDFRKLQKLKLWGTGDWQLILLDTRAALVGRETGKLPSSEYR